MSYWSRIVNVFRGDRLSRDIEEELKSHIEEAIERGRNPEEARRAFGSILHAREQSRDLRIAAWLDSLRADATFGVRHLFKNRATSGAAILSLALAIGACMSAFRLIDAVLLRPLPVTDPHRLYFLAYEYKDRNGKTDLGDSFQYPVFRELRTATKEKAELLAISYSARVDLTYGSDQEMEKAHRQYVSGWVFPTFGLKPAAGRLLTPEDDVKPGGHPYAVLSYDYWTRRFGREPKVVGRMVRMGSDSYRIVGVAQEGFTGTEPGTQTDLFIPMMMNAKAIDNPGWSWFRTWMQLRPGADPEAVRQFLQVRFRELRQENAKTWNNAPKDRVEEYVNAPLAVLPAAAGVSGMQKNYRHSLVILAVLVGLVLLIACANVANLMTAQAASRSREMALRISIGAGRWRLMQLVLIESTLIAIAASIVGGLFAWWSAPFVVGLLNPPDDPARLSLPADWRLLGFAVALTLVVTVLFGLIPAMRASGVKPMSTLKGGEDPHSRRRLMNALVASQVAFCFLVHFVAGLFMATFDRLSGQSTGFNSDRLLILESVSKQKQPASHWAQVTEHLRTTNGVESAALSMMALMAGSSWSNDIWVNGRLPERDGPYFLGVSPRWLDTMQIRLIDGRDFREDDQHPSVAIVNETFARRYFDGQSPIGKTFETMRNKDKVRIRIVGYVRDARYRNMRETIRPTIYVPFSSALGPTDGIDWGSFIVRTAGDPLPLASMLRQEVSRARPGFRVSNIHTQAELVRRHTVRERLLAMLSLFFAAVALVLAAVGLYGVLNYSVLQRQREIGIRMALGAQAGDVARRVTADVFGMLILGALTGLGLGIVSEQYFSTLLYQVKATDLTMLSLPAITIFAAALLAVLPPVIRAVRIDPALTLRAE